MVTPVAFNVTAAAGPVPRGGYRVYLTPDQIYFIHVGDLGRLSDAGRPGDHGGGVSWLNFLAATGLSGLFLFAPVRADRPAGWELLREAEKKPLPERLEEDPDSFSAAPADLGDAVLAPARPTFWSTTHGDWTFTLPDRGRVSFTFPGRLDLLRALNHLPGLLGNALRVLPE